tara:strand:- start:447 stop:596 length:150 start_codon:yes stop_codon:yes gene_type:complete
MSREDKYLNEAIELISDVISSGAKTGYDKDSVYDAWHRILRHLLIFKKV